MIDELILGLLDTPMETLDNFITEEVTNHLFEKKKVPYSGMDLISLNIQRGRMTMFKFFISLLVQ